MCFFYLQSDMYGFSNDSLPTGDWSTEGCSSKVDNEIVTCSCNHLTHFAILLSPGVDEV